MTIPKSKIMSAGFVIVDGEESLREILARTDILRHYYVVVAFPEGKFAAVGRVDLDAMREEFKNKGKEDFILNRPIWKILQDFAFQPLEIATDLGEAQAYVKKLPGRFSVVVNDVGNIQGLFFAGVSRNALKPDDQLVEALLESQPEPKGRKRPMAGEEPTASAEPAPVEPKERFINIEMRDKSRQTFDAKQYPLQRGEPYTLVFDIDEIAHGLSVTAASIDAAFGPKEESIELTVRLVSADFEIPQKEQTLLVPKNGKSLNEAVFIIRPIRDGQAQISAHFLRGHNLIQTLSLSFQVGELFRAEKLGKPLEAAFSAAERDLNLTIVNTGTGFHISMDGAESDTAVIALTVPQLDQMITQVRKALLDIVEASYKAKKVYQVGIDIPEEVNQNAMLHLATEGYYLFQRLFFGPASGEDGRRLGQVLRKTLSKPGNLHIQIYSREFTLPWGLLYLSETRPKTTSEVNPDLFMGLRHVIEQIPLQPDMVQFENAIAVTKRIQVGLNMNYDIGQTIVKEQVDYWENKQLAGKAAVVVRKSSAEVLEALAKTEDTPDQVMYFYCHAISRSLLEGENPDASTLLFTNKQAVTLRDLYLDAGLEKLLAQQPLIFINACQSAELSPLFYDGFVPYFMAKGARGVIGTECDTPALFAKEWARRFFDYFLDGERLGEIILKLRQEFFQQHHNILGLLYAIYVDGDTHLAF